jgi:hypothetical protein
MRSLATNRSMRGYLAHNNVDDDDESEYELRAHWASWTFSDWVGGGDIHQGNRS